ncbi:MAG: hypothetical protein V4819_25535 [Verrucomicrobiota bacterium]
MQPLPSVPVCRNAHTFSLSGDLLSATPDKLLIHSRCFSRDQTAEEPTPRQGS